ncbi:hypothetical protein E2320_003973 [Naja naja]|nr:hypothetical protein E2320_003973 [Naja naja]
MPRRWKYSNRPDRRPRNMIKETTATVPFVSAQEGGEWGGGAATARCREGRAPALWCSAAGYPSECAVVAAGEIVTATTTVILAQERILHGRTRER